MHKLTPDLFPEFVQLFLKKLLTFGLPCGIIKEKLRGGAKRPKGTPCEVRKNFLKYFQKTP
jgi:hypothetical protein